MTSSKMKKLGITILLCVFQISSCKIIVQTNSGLIRSTDSLSPDVEAFLGIPFAEPPVGDLRFAKPVPKESWTDIYDASKLPPPCSQFKPDFSYYFLADLSDMAEDCLYLNIWTPNADTENDLRPVIIYIHHGAFVSGSSNQKEFDGSHLASRGDVVVVTINYRLGLFGFLFADVEEANGNMGMYDQLTAIQWVSENAKYFGGDPSNVVLVGTSAGAVSAGALMVSPLSQNLFRRVFFQSSSIITPLYLDGNDRLLKNSEQIASMTGCSNGTLTFKNNPSSVVQCLKARPAETLLEAESIILKSKPVLFFPRSGDQFLPKDARLMYREGKFRKEVDVMIGTAIDEGCLLLFIAAPQYFGKYGQVPLTKMTKSQIIFIARTAATVVGIKNFSEKVNIYNNLVKNRTGLGYTKMMTNVLGDFGIVCGSVFLAEVLALAGNPVYFYKFAHHAASTPMADWVQATHVDDVQYMFGNPYHENFTGEEVKLSNRFIDRLSAFAKTGNPNVPGEVRWMQYSYHNPLYLHIGQHEESLQMRPWNRCEIWRKDFQSEIDSNLVLSLNNLIPSDSENVQSLNDISQSDSNSGFKGVREISLASLLLACLSVVLSYRIDTQPTLIRIQIW